jgi:acetyltransferase-like isoleucine patch superfamily enzyme
MRQKKKRENLLPRFTNEYRQYNKPNIRIGDYTYGFPIIKEFASNQTNLRIGKFCSIAANVSIILGGEHPTKFVSTYPIPIKFDVLHEFQRTAKSKGDIEIGNDVWIGYGVIILTGVKIGNGAVIGAGSVVTKSVEPYSIVAGNPAKLVRYRFSNQIIIKLEGIAWWDWPIEKIISASSLLISDKIDEFVRKYDPEIIGDSGENQFE